MTAETIEQKALRYIQEGRVKVISLAPGDITVSVQGSSPTPYLVRFVNGVGVCPCPARVWRCAHVYAASLVVDESAIDAQGEPDDLDLLLGTVE